MQVKELIEFLKTQNPGHEVLVQDANPEFHEFLNGLLPVNRWADEATLPEEVRMVRRVYPLNEEGFGPEAEEVVVLYLDSVAASTDPETF